MSEWRFVVVSYNSDSPILRIHWYVGEDHNSVFRAVNYTAGFSRDRVSIGCIDGVSHFADIDLACLSWHASALSEEVIWTLKHLCDQGFFIPTPTYRSGLLILSDCTHARLFRRRDRCAIYLC